MIEIPKSYLCPRESVNRVSTDFERQLPPVEHLPLEGVSFLLEIGLGFLSGREQRLEDLREEALPDTTRHKFVARRRLYVFV